MKIAGMRKSPAVFPGKALKRLRIQSFGPAEKQAVYAPYYIQDFLNTGRGAGGKITRK